MPRGSVSPQRVSNGVVLFPTWQQVADPSITRLTTQQNLNQRSSLRAIADSSGRLLLINPTPGLLGSLSPHPLTAPHFLRFDANLIKRFRLREAMNFELRLDAIDLLNAPQFAAFDTDINSPSFGRVTGSFGERLVVVGVRLNF